MNFIQNNTDPSSYINKAKKQAKRLLQLSQKTNNNLAIESLSVAQETLAKINGFPDWHAFLKYINKENLVEVVNNTNEVITFTPDVYTPVENFFYKEDNRFYTSSFYLNIDGESEYIKNVVASITSEIEFYFCY